MLVVGVEGRPGVRGAVAATTQTGQRTWVSGRGWGGDGSSGFAGVDRRWAETGLTWWAICGSIPSCESDPETFFFLSV